ncbi:formate dehydrogenase [Pusillimonas sp. T2]|uniref:formate dehydrogenase subunit delta n=1 Tax=Pusillimonas sp. T2 TaxID=1548123 RepID=UPI000B9CCE8B|nr:formate dehydrogenase subunit delta [Pusillimonas sp. T2]OXR50662.1 formate dehydrogenase [Pusillimonas sp. T2]
MNNIDHLIKLANRIGDFFNAMPDRAEGIEGVTNHIQKFWEPRMRKALLDYLAAHPDGKTPNIELNAIALEALTQHRDRLMPKTATTA